MDEYYIVEHDGYRTEYSHEELEHFVFDSICPSACEHEVDVEHDGHCYECGAPSVVSAVLW